MHCLFIFWSNQLPVPLPKLNTVTGLVQEFHELTSNSMPLLGIVMDILLKRPL